MANGNTSDYYKQNDGARRKRNAQQARYNKTKKGKDLRINANALNRQLGTYGNGDNMDASHTGPRKGRKEDPSTNRRRPRLKIKYA
tara:strand:+ start:18138 stop:18395 length:258 start_codon:yes stop_codon:yes gene_type:complete